MFLAAHAAPRRRHRFFGTGGAPPPPTEIDRRAAADTMMSAHSSIWNFSNVHFNQPVYVFPPFNPQRHQVISHICPVYEQFENCTAQFTVVNVSSRVNLHSTSKCAVLPNQLSRRSHDQPEASILGGWRVAPHRYWAQG